MATAPKLVTLRARPAKQSPLTPELREFIDRAIVPALVKQYLAELDDENELAKPNARVSQSLSSTAARLRGR
jgi:hypothetical protein